MTTRASRRSMRRPAADSRAPRHGHVARHHDQVHDQRSSIRAPRQHRHARTPDGADVRGDPARVHAAASGGSGRLARRAQRSARRQGAAAAARQPDAELDGRRAGARGGDVTLRSGASGSLSWSAKRRCGTSPTGACSWRSRCCEKARTAFRRSRRVSGMSRRPRSTGRSSAPPVRRRPRGARGLRAYPHNPADAHDRCFTTSRQ